MEIEAKFQLLDTGVIDIHTLRDLFVQSGYVAERASEPIHIVDVYFDRVDHALREAGAAVRVRKENTKVLLTYKCKVAQEGELHSRIELEAEPTEEHLKHVYRELESLALVPANDQAQQIPTMAVEEHLKAWGLTPILEINTKRFRLDISNGDRNLAVVVLDRVQFELGSRKGGYSGIEIEAVHDEGVEVVVELSKALKVRFGKSIQAQKISKYEFALQRLGIGG